MENVEHRQFTVLTAYCRPVLEALVDMGGSGATADVLRQVFGKMEATLTGKDREPVSGGEARWRNTARWARKLMVNDGRLRKDSPAGRWDISEEGRGWLRAQRRRTGTRHPTPQHRQTVTVPPRILARAQKQAARQRRSLSDVVSQLLGRWVGSRRVARSDR